jgi:hypothetical protein
MSQLNLQTLGSELHTLLPEFTAYSADFRDYLADPVDHSLYGVFNQFAYRLRKLMDEGNQEELTRYFSFVNRLLESPDEYLAQVTYDCIIEALAHNGKYYYQEATKYLSPAGIETLNWCKNNPPLGLATPPD